MPHLVVGSVPRAFARLFILALAVGFVATAPARAATDTRVEALVVPTINIDDVTIAEGDGVAKNAVFTVSLSEPTTVDVGFMVGTAEVGAIGNDDFQHFYSSPRTIPAGQTSLALDLVIFGDTVLETDESFQVLLEAVSNATVGKGVGIGTIVNDDAGAAPTLMVGDLWIAEGSGGSKIANFTVQLSQPAAGDVNFSVATANGTASAGSDYTALSLAGQVIPAGQLSKTVSVTIAGDTSPERDESFQVNLSNVAGAVLGRSQATGTIGNDDSVSSVKISVGDAYAQEGSNGSKVVTFYVSLTKAAASTVTFDICTEYSSATAGSDYQALSLVGQTIAAGQTGKAFSVTVFGDTTPESNERFVLTLSNIVNAAVQYADPHGVVTIPNDDATVSISDASVLEGDAGNTSMQFLVTLSNTVEGAVNFMLTACDGTATVSGGDYSRPGDTTLKQFPAFATTMTVSVSVNGDLEQEEDETFCVDVTQLNGAQPGDTHAIGTIINDDLGPSTFSIGDASVVEGDSGFAYLAFPYTLDRASKVGINVSYHTESCGGTAQPDVAFPYQPGDYTSASGTNVQVSTSGGGGNFYVSVRGDTNYEPDEQFCLKIDGISGAKLGKDTAIGTIVNDDALPALSVSNSETSERNPGLDWPMIFSVYLSKVSATDVTFDVVTDYGTAAPDVDFVSTSLVGLTIPAGQASTTFEVLVKGDEETELDEAFTVNLRNVVGAPVAKAQGRGLILDNDWPTLSVDGVTIEEGDDGRRTATFVVSLSHPVSRAILYNIATTAGTATPGEDFVATSQVDRLMDPGRSRAVFEVPIIGDDVVEADETFAVSLSIVRGAWAGGLAFATIEDDDAPAVASIADIQGSGATSPLVGKAVRTEGVVTALARGGFFLQSRHDQQDAYAATAEGLFVSRQGSNVAVGDAVQVSGVVQEVSSVGSPDALLTTLIADAVKVTGRERALPRPVALVDGTGAPAATASSLEPLEGMRVSGSPLTVLAASGGSIDERSSRVRSDGRFHASVRDGEGAAHRLQIVSTGQPGAPALSADAGDIVSGLVGVLRQGGGGFELLPDPRAAIRIASRARPTAVAGAGASEVALGSMDVRRFFDSSRATGEPVMSPGAYATRLAKTANAICAYARSPAILGVHGIENPDVLGDIAAAVNSRAGNLLFPGSCAGDPDYVALVDESVPGGRGLGVLASTATVRPGVARVEVRSATAQAHSEIFGWRDGGREPLFDAAPLLVHARINAADGSSLDLAVLVAHAAGAPGREAHGWPSRSEYVRARRAAQADALADVIRSHRRAQPGLPLVVMGDVDALAVEPELVDLGARLPAVERYSAVRDGRPIAADKVLVSQDLLEPAFEARVEMARINADFGEDNHGDARVPVRIADRDPVILFLRTH